MRSIVATGLTLCAGVIIALSLGGCGGQEVAEPPADEPVRSADDAVLHPLEEEARAAEDAKLNQ